MELRHLRLVKTIAEEGNIARSSDLLFVTQSALSHQLRDLESMLGFKVFFRNRGRWTLTEEGAELYKLANNVLKQIESGLNNIETIKSGATGTIRISTECYSFYHGLPSFIQKMAILYPDIQVDLILEATHQPMTKLLSNDIDMAIVTSHIEDEQLHYEHIFEDEIFALIHKDHALSQKPHIDAEDFRDTPLIIHSYPLETVSIYTHFLKPKNIKPNRVSSLPLTEVALEMVEANMGMICMPEWALKMFKLSENIKFQKISASGIKRKHYLACRTADMEKRYIRDFIAYFNEIFNKNES